jgi:hypothetical protein
VSIVGIRELCFGYFGRDDIWLEVSILPEDEVWFGIRKGRKAEAGLMERYNFAFGGRLLMREGGRDLKGAVLILQTGQPMSWLINCQSVSSVPTRWQPLGLVERHSSI